MTFKYNDLSRSLLDGRYLLEHETLEQGFKRACDEYATDAAHAARLYYYVMNGWFMFASPVLATAGNKKGLPISCYLTYVPDSHGGLADHFTEIMYMSAKGGGVGSYYGHVRSDGEITKAGNKSSGVMPFTMIEDAIMAGWRQGTTRGGASAIYIDISHPEIEEFVEVRRPGRDPARTFRQLHNAVNIPDAFMVAVKNGDSWDLKDPHSGVVRKTVDARKLWLQILKTRVETGEPYIHFIDSSNRALSDNLKSKGLRINSSNLCSEIILPTSEDISAVCCLSSLNLAAYDQWEDTDIVSDLVEMLDNVLDKYVEKAKDIHPLRRAVRSVELMRDIGLGTMGFHTYLQSKSIPFASALARSTNKRMFKKLSNQAVEASKRLAVVRGEPEYLKGTGRRNAHLMAIAPNASSADLLNQVSAGIEPISAPMYQKKTNAGPFTVRNPHLDDYFQRKYGYDKFHVDKAWTEVLNNNCSLTGLDHLADADTQAVFAKAAEIDQMWLVELAADRQHYIDQAQSLNLFFSPSSDGSVDTNYLHKVHFAAWEKGVKTLYYLRSDSVGKGESLSRNDKICLGCEG